MLKTLFRECKQHQIVRKKQTFKSCSSSSDTLFDSTVTVYPIHIDYMKRSGDRTQSCRSQTPTANDCDLTLPTQTSEHEYSDLTASNRRPSAPCSRSTPQSISRGTRSYAFSRSTKHALRSFGFSLDFSKISWRVRICFEALLPGRQMHWVSSSFGSIVSRHHFSRNLAYTFPGRQRRKMNR